MFGESMFYITFITALMEIFKKLIDFFVENCGDKIINYFRKNIQNYKYSISIASKTIINKRGYKENENNLNNDIIRSILYYLNNTKNTCDHNLLEYNFIDMDNHRRSNSNKKDKIINYIPSTELNIMFKKYKINICIKETIDKKESGETINKEVILGSSDDILKDFIEHCEKIYKDEVINKEENGTFCFKQYYDREDGQLLKKYEINNNKTTFDSIFFNDKHQIINLIDKLQNKKINKLGLLLYGEPGTGKTSIIKAIANYTKRSIINIKLSLIEKDSDLEDIFLSSHINMRNNKINGSNKYININNEKRIYVFEDIDAECDVIKKRESITSKNKVDILKDMEKLLNKKDKKPNNDNDNNDSDSEDDKQGCDESYSSLFSKYTKQNYNKLTLSGILNVLDGVVEINDTIIIMTTNHPENLDPALTRYGRIHKKLHLGKMTKENAALLIKKYFTDYKDEIDELLINDKIKNNNYNPSELEALCQEYQDDFDQFIEKL
jgi:hypothetical protein